MEDESQACWPSAEITLTFPNERFASIVEKAVNVDPEIRPNRVHRSCHQKDSNLIMFVAIDLFELWQLIIIFSQVSASDLFSLRVSVSSFLEMIDMSVRTIMEFAS